MKILIILFSFLFSCGNPVLITPSIEEGLVVRVIDGDTFEASIDGRTKRIRLAELDTPELPTKEGQIAKWYLFRMIYRKNVRMDYTAIDPHKRYVAFVFLNGININQHLINKGYAKYVHYYNKNKLK